MKQKKKNNQKNKKGQNPEFSTTKQRVTETGAFIKQTPKREMTDRSLIEKTLDGEDKLTKRGLLMYWCFWANKRYLKKFESIIDEFGNETVFNAIIMLHMLSNKPMTMMIYAIETKSVPMFIHKLNFNAINLEDGQLKQYQLTQKNFVKTTTTKYKLDAKQNPNLESHFLSGDLWQ